MLGLNRIGQRLTLGAGLVVALSLLAGLFGMRAGHELTRQYESLFACSASQNRASAEIQTALAAMQHHLQDAALAAHPHESAALLAEADNAWQTACTQLGVLGAKRNGHAAEVQGLREGLASWRTSRERVAEYKAAGNDIDAIDTANRQAGALATALQAGIMNTTTDLVGVHRGTASGIMERQRRTNLHLALFLVLTAMLTTVLGLQATRVLIDPLHRMADLADDIRRGHLDHRLHLGRNDEIGAVADALDEMAAGIQGSRAELEAHHAELEHRVAERTAELVRAHEILNAEFDLRETMGARLQESEERLDLMTIGTADGFWDWPDLASGTMWWSPRVYDLLEVDPKECHPGLTQLLDRCHDEDTPSLEGALRYGADGGTRPDLEFRIRRPDGSLRWVHLRGQVFQDDDGQPLRMAGSLQDIDDRKWAEAQLLRQNAELEALNSRLATNQNQLIQSEKMSSLGQLAAGVAHEINNPVGFITSNLGTMVEYAGTLRDLVGPLVEAAARGESLFSPALRTHLAGALADEDFAYILEDSAQLLAESLEGTVRIVEIVNSLKSFARPDQDVMVPADINDGLETALRMVWNQLKYKCVLEKDLAPLPLVSCNIGRLNQVFMNLLVNASHAVEKDGHIRISTAHAAGHVEIKVQDDGQGIPPERLGRIFEPFYTTKPVGTGTGLGLSISHGIVADHHGTITVASEEGRGTTFTIRIPDDLKPDVAADAAPGATDTADLDGLPIG